MNIAEVPEGDTIPPDFFQDVRIRQAFNYAFNYQGYIDGILGGQGGRASFVLPTGMFGYDPDAPIYETDPAMAEQLFTEAGYWEEGFTVSIITDQTHEGFTGAALTLKDSIEALNPNFHINVLQLPEAQFDEQLATDPLPVGMWSYTSSQYSNPDAYLFDTALSDGRYGAVNSFADGYADAQRVDDLVAAARRLPGRRGAAPNPLRDPDGALRGGGVDHAGQRGRAIGSWRLGDGPCGESDVAPALPVLGHLRQVRNGSGFRKGEGCLGWL